MVLVQCLIIALVVFVVVEAVATFPNTNPNLKDEEIAAEFDCDRSTISKILKQKKWSEIQEISPTSNAFKTASPKFSQIERALEMWIGTVEQHKLTLTGEVIRQKALHFAALLGISEEEFRASQGWFTRFKARIGLCNHKFHGEAESAPIELLPQFREELKNILATYEPQDVFNADECSLYYRMESSFSLLTTIRKELQFFLRLMQMALKNLYPLVINKSKMPNAFRDANITYNQLPVDYYYNETAWMRQNIFKKFLCNLQSKFQIQERRVLLLVDGATFHTVDNLNEYSNIHAHYKCFYIRKVINDFDIGIEKPNKIDVLQAIWLVNKAWNTISEETVKNCWRHTGILPFRHLVEIFSSNENFENESINIFEIIEAQREAQEIIDLTNNTNLQQLVQEYLNNDDFVATEEVMDDNQIIELINNPDINNNKADNLVEEEPRITFTEAERSLNLLLKFICQNLLQPDGFIKENDESNFRNFLSRTHRASVKVMKQSTLENFLSVGGSLYPSTT
ncbi:4009_t:CDS:2 [Gigaspora margarita]|uniref:4009_t:CDS:1 n=1 Tax=Gigaspora margarita TaxID=4874 RepID=A0ABN7UIJ1_GIGMA|nr:4009_t:CDS:2 [Gigaspora margarita]